ncbi:hypothetical protein [Chryseobacterium taklimakanense]|uniref:Uncharacterized protein n=1 Tax=Chryseobacterium taklimakanense TaxID=536441 RepID=A0A3G8WT08_9FLAO|nr:hypothetical protein [Chryseobacterium taklimakanense]AZI19521.1 hypothetical protein EIH08_01195 [Chryseobacterium taklimakanense]
MTKKFGLWFAAFLALLLQSCSVNTETTYYKDSATSMESNVLMDRSTLGLLSMMGDASDAVKKPLVKTTRTLLPSGRASTTFKKQEK